MTCTNYSDSVLKMLSKLFAPKVLKSV